MKHILALLTLTVLATSCNKTTPASFWKDYEKDLIVKNISDQGPWGGHREMYWKSVNKNTFTARNVIDFAIKNGWEFADSISFSAETIKKWKNNKPTFPFTYTDFSDDNMNTSTFTRWITADIKVFRFKTGWIAVEPGNARETEKNGYVVINSVGTELSVYHLWGE